MPPTLEVSLEAARCVNAEFWDSIRQQNKRILLLLESLDKLKKENEGLKAKLIETKDKGYD